ncbi:MAG: hypothetical protein DRJ21_00465 [Candidatus Methanomethylicota archaeon]|uniref:Molybdopterin dinucleotide-binding domain-containing protein n=1 Tax=Thermoproteota archaeon TaxID=2056631 RepID=A0A497EX36_9CREN|nr:MAG: hypothetical protein DRJ21_00465 [Candidatus Verstraetearchaeota archaeon]
MIRLTLIIERTHDQELAAKISTCNEEYVKSSAIAFLSKNDMEKLKIKDGDCIEVSFMTSRVLVRAYGKEGVNEGIIVMPLSPWSMNLIPLIISPEGFPIYGRITVTVKPVECTSISINQFIS